MKCVVCDNPKFLKKESKAVKYKESGLKNVTLVGVVKYECDRCGEAYYEYGNMEKLHTVIAQLLIAKRGLLIGSEARFLRAHLGYSGAVFAKLTGYRPESISRIENSENQVEKKFDRLVRALVESRLPNRNYDLHDLWLREEGKVLKQIRLKSDNGGWTVEQAA